MKKVCKDCEEFGETYDGWCDAFECEVNEEDKGCEVFVKKGAPPPDYSAAEKLLEDIKLKSS